ncbi:hypothetical protein ACLB2K_075308 [Fragaria x ananassa]
MQTHHTISWFSQFTLLSVLLLLLFFKIASGFGSMGPISASFGESGFFCAIDASGKQEVVCWGKNSSASTPSSASLPTSASFSNIPAMAALSGGEGFLCSILSNTSQAYCWSSIAAGVVNMLIGWCFLPRLTTSLKEEGTKKQFKSCIGKPELEADNNEDSEAPLSVVPCPGMAQVFRLSEGVLRSSSMKG